MGREAEAVVRGALLAPDGSAVWEHRVNRVTRADEGIWRRPVAGGPSARVLPGLPASGRFGPTFVTELSWAADGRLGVSSCGERACRTRVMDPATGRVDAFEGTGPLVGVHEDRALVHGACSGLPCPIETVDLRTGRRSVLVEQAGLASVDGSGTGSLVFETPRGPSRSPRPRIRATVGRPCRRRAPARTTDLGGHQRGRDARRCGARRSARPGRTAVGRSPR